MSAVIIKLPYSVTRAAHSRKPRRSKNGTPEERALKTAASENAADIVPMSDIRAAAHSEVDRRKLRTSPLRDGIATISFGATVVGKIHTAGLKDEPLAGIQPEIRKEWLETLERAIGALAAIGLGLSQAVTTLKALQSETSYSPVNLPVPDLGQSVLNLTAEERGGDH